jgi:hypothetical protein
VDAEGRDCRVTLRPLRSDVPAVVRLRRFLKLALRAFGLRAVEVAEVERHGAGEKGAGGR